MNNKQSDLAEKQMQGMSVSELPVASPNTIYRDEWMKLRAERERIIYAFEFGWGLHSETSPALI